MKKKILSILTAVAVLGVTACTAALNSSAYSGEGTDFPAVKVFMSGRQLMRK